MNNDAENIMSRNEFRGPESIHFEVKSFRLSIVLLVRFVRFMKEQVSIVLLQECETVNETADVKQNMRLV